MRCAVSSRWTADASCFGRWPRANTRCQYDHLRGRTAQRLTVKNLWAPNNLTSLFGPKRRTLSRITKSERGSRTPRNLTVPGDVLDLIVA